MHGPELPKELAALDDCFPVAGERLGKAHLAQAIEILDAPLELVDGMEGGLTVALHLEIPLALLIVLSRATAPLTSRPTHFAEGRPALA